MIGAAKLISAILTLNVTLLVSVSAMSFMTVISRRIWVRLDWRWPTGNELKVHYLMMIWIGLAALAILLLPNRAAVFSPIAKVWAAPSAAEFERSYRPSGEGFVGVNLTKTPALWAKLRWSDEGAELLLILITLSVAARIVREIWLLRGCLKDSILIRKIGRVHILANDFAGVPFSFWWPGRAFVVVPSWCIDSRLKVIVAHELQHHRQGDTVFVYPMAVLSSLCWVNPAFRFWHQQVSELQEFACDETMVDQGRVDSLAYARLLVEVAQNRLELKHVSVCATGIVNLQRPKQLHRRIERMLSLEENKRYFSRSMSSRLGWLAAGLCAFVVAGAAFASNGWLQDRRVTAQDADVMLRTATKNGSTFPIEMNELVLKQLNRYLGTPEGREFIRESLVRLQEFEAPIQAKLTEYGLPSELMAVPLIESGFQNRPQNTQHKEWGAGLWSVIESTARAFGLRVDSERDERLDVVRESDAALRYLAANHLRFSDWRLAAMAYNIGENRLEAAIEKWQTRDPWVLIAKGTENDRDYLPKLMAAVIILKNPEAVK